jgi:hypothetical protein
VKGELRRSISLADLVPKYAIQVKGRYIPFSNNVKCHPQEEDYMGTAANGLATYIRTCSLIKDERLSIDTKPILCKAVFRSIMVYVCPI